MTKHSHQFVHNYNYCQICGLTELEIYRIMHDRKRGTPDGTQRNTGQVAKPASTIPQRER